MVDERAKRCTRLCCTYSARSLAGVECQKKSTSHPSIKSRSANIRAPMKCWSPSTGATTALTPNGDRGFADRRWRSIICIVMAVAKCSCATLMVPSCHISPSLA